MKLFIFIFIFASISITAETVGFALIERQNSDGTLGGVFLADENQPFSQSGQVMSWGFYNLEAGASGRKITPLLFRKIGSNYQVIGIGETRTNQSTGAQNFSFNLQSGTNVVQQGDLYGWKEGTPSTHDYSTVETDYTIGGLTGRMLFFGQQVSVSVGTNLTGPSVFTRDYAIQFTTTSVPELDNWLLMSLVLCFSWGLKRNR